MLLTWHSGKELTHPCRRPKKCRFNPWVREDLLEKEMATHSSILAWEIPQTEELMGYSPCGHKNQTWPSDWILYSIYSHHKILVYSLWCVIYSCSLFYTNSLHFLIRCMWNLKKYNKLVNITKKKQAHRYREQNIGLWHMIFLLKKKNLNSQIHLGFRQGLWARQLRIYKYTENSLEESEL